MKRLVCCVVSWFLCQFYCGMALAFTMDLDHAVNTLFKVRTATRVFNAGKPVAHIVGPSPARLPQSIERALAENSISQEPASANTSEQISR